MNLPGVGEIKPQYLYFGGAAVGAAVLYGLYRSRKSKAAANAAAADSAIANTTASDAGAVDSGSVYGGVTGTPYQDMAYQQYLEYGTQQAYSNNEAWAEAAIQYAVGDLGVSGPLAQESVRDYLLQSNAGLPPNEYQVMSELIALIGPPPTGSFKLHENFSAVATAGDSGTGNPSRIITSTYPVHAGVSGPITAVRSS